MAAKRPRPSRSTARVARRITAPRRTGKEAGRREAGRKEGGRKEGGAKEGGAGKPVAGKPGGGRPSVTVRRIHRRDLNRVWEFLKVSFAQVNLETVEYQRPRTKKRFMKTYDEEGIDQLVFEVEGEIVAYAECAHEVVGTDSWINESYFKRRNMRPLFVEELAVHPRWNGLGVGSFVMEQLHHLAKVRGLSHLVLEVAENNEHALAWYRKRGFRKLDAAVFMAAGVASEPELLPPKPVRVPTDGPPATPV